MAILLPIFAVLLVLGSFFFAVGIEGTNQYKKHEKLFDYGCLGGIIFGCLFFLSTPFYLEYGVMDNSVVRLNDDGSIDSGNKAYFCTDTCANFKTRLRVDTHLKLDAAHELHFSANPVFNPKYSSALSAILTPEVKQKYDWPLDSDISDRLVQKSYQPQIQALIEKNRAQILAYCSGAEAEAGEKDLIALLYPDLEQIFKQVSYRLDDIDINELECVSVESE